MEVESILAKIQSQHILKNVISYLKEENYIYKLVIYSKSLQEKLNVERDTYQLLFIKQLNLHLKRYLVKNEYGDNCEKKLNDDLKKFGLNKNVFKKYVINYYNDILEKNKKEKKLKFEKIDIYSPFFNILLTKDFNFSEIFTIIIDIKSKNDYSSYSKASNELEGRKFSILFYYKNRYNVEKKFFDYFKNHFKNLILFGLVIDKYSKYDVNLIEQNRLLFKEIFSYNDLLDNLLNLSLIGPYLERIKIEQTIFENINNFKSLITLTIIHFSLDRKIIIKISTLKNIYLEDCKKITLSDEACLNIKTLEIYDCEFPPSDSLLVMPELEECKIEISNKEEKIVNLFKSKKLKDLRINPNVFLELENLHLESVEIIFPLLSKENEIKLIKKILSMNTLKKAELYFKYVSNEDISNIEGINYSLTSLSIYAKGFIFYELQKKFPNLTKINIVGEKYVENASKLPIIEIKETLDSKINNLSLNSNDCKFYCGLFENLISFSLRLGKDSLVGNIKECFPIFNPSSKTIFKSLTILEISVGFEVKNEIIQNMMNNLDNIPKLEHFKCNINVDNISQKLYLNFIGKILSKNLNFVWINIRIYKNKTMENHLLSENELRQMFPKLKFPKKLTDVYIYSLNGSDCLII